MSDNTQKQITEADFTPEIYEEVRKYEAIANDNLTNGTEYNSWKYEDTVEYINYVLNLSEQGKRVILVTDNPLEYDHLFYCLFSDDFMDEVQIPVRDLYNEMIANPTVDYTTAMIEMTNRFKQQPISNRKPLDVLYHWSGLLSEYSRACLMWYQILANQFNQINEHQDHLNWLWERVCKASILKVYITDMVILVVRMPEFIHNNDLGFHNPKGYAIDHRGYGKYYINGRLMPDLEFGRYLSGEMTFDEFNKITSEDTRAGIITAIRETKGEEGVLEFLGATLIDETNIEHHNRVGYELNMTEDDEESLKNLYPGLDVQKMVMTSVDEAFDKFKRKVESKYVENLQLYRTVKKFPFAMDRNRKQNVQLAWVRYICPSTGTNYLISTCPTFDNVVDAAKFARPAVIPMGFDYKWLSAN